MKRPDDHVYKSLDEALADLFSNYKELFDEFNQSWHQDQEELAIDAHGKNLL